LSKRSAAHEVSGPLPAFTNPPVVETVLSVQFEPIPGLQTVYLGLLWDEYRSDFPKTEEHAPMDSVTEQFPEIPVARMGLKFQALDVRPAPRLCFISAKGNEMIQVQSDRFIKNWRKEGEEEQYPRYESTIRPNFDRDFTIFLDFLKKNNLSIPRVNQCEVTYVNHVLAGYGWQHYGDLETLFAFWRQPDLKPPGPAEDLRLHMRFIIPDDAGVPIGRLHVELQPAVRVSDNHPMYVLHLTARGQIGSGIDFLDVGREWIVKSFERLTTSSMHLVWGIQDNAGPRNH